MKYYYNVEDDDSRTEITRPMFLRVHGDTTRCVEKDLLRFERIYLFDITDWNCETIEELRDSFYESLRDDVIAEYWIFETFLTEEDVAQRKVYESLSE